jgi:hypothetical protein
MSNLRKSKFVPIPRHAMDLKTQRIMAQAINSLLNSQIVAGTKNQAHHSDSNVIYEIDMTGGSTQDFLLVSDGGDYYNCNAYDGATASGPIVKVAKHQDIRCILPTASPAGGAWPTKTIRGITYTYVYNPVAGSTTDGVNVVEYTRSVSGSDGSTAISEITPCLNIGDIITADSTTFKGPATLVGVIWQAQASGRAWTDKPTD